MPSLCAQQTVFLLRLISLSVIVHRICSGTQNDRQLQSVATQSKNSAEESEPLGSTIPNLDRLPDLLIINPTFEPPLSHVPGQSVTRRELLLRTLHLRQQPTETAGVSHALTAPKAQPLPKLDGQFLIGGKRREMNAQQLISGASSSADPLAYKRTKGEKETHTSPLDKARSRPFPLRPENEQSALKVITPATDSNGSIRSVKQQREFSSTETDALRGNRGPSNTQQQQILQNSLIRQRIQLQKPTEIAPSYDNGNQQQPQQNNQQQQFPNQLRSVPQFHPQQQQQQQQLPPYQPNFSGQPSPSGSTNFFAYPPQPQQNTFFAAPHQSQQQKAQQISAPRRLNFYFTPSATTVNSDFSFAPGSPGLACFYGFPVPQYNTPRKRCMPDHPMCGIQFTCVMDVHAVDEWGREVEQWWTEVHEWDGATQQTLGGAAETRGGTRAGAWGTQQQQQQTGTGWMTRPV